MQTDFKCEPIVLTPEELQEVFRIATPSPEFDRGAERHCMGQINHY